VPYRDEFPAADPEELAVKELAARAARVRRGILVPAIVVGLLGAIAGYLAVREIQFAMLHAQMPWLSGVVGGVPPFAAALKVAQRAGDAAVARRAPAWVAEQLERHGLPPGSLDDFLSVL